jgi:hypothetical protein
MQLSPLLCGHWDDCSFWCQWTPLEGATYHFEWRWRMPGGGWSQWQSVERSSGGIVRPWVVVPTYRPGAEVEARVALWSGPDPGREPTGEIIASELAEEVTFSQSRCLFRVSSTQRDLTLRADDTISAHVDGAACTYVLESDVVVLKGTSQIVMGKAIERSGYAQLDHARHFFIQPFLGVTIYNEEPSTSDVEKTGRMLTQISAAKLIGPIFMAIERRTSL